MTEDVSFKEFLKRLSKLPIVYIETFQATQPSIPILSLPKPSIIHDVPISIMAAELDEITVKILNGQVFKVTRTGKVEDLKRKVSSFPPSMNSTVRIIHQGRALGDDFDLFQLPKETTLQAVITNTSVPINTEALKRDMSTLLLRHGIPPVQIDSLVSSFISQLPQ